MLMIGFMVTTVMNHWMRQELFMTQPKEATNWSLKAEGGEI